MLRLMLLLIDPVRANFEFINKGLDYWCFHNRDIAPDGDGKTLEEANANLDEVVAFAKELQGNKKVLWVTAQLFMHPRYMHGGATSSELGVCAYAAAQVKKAMEGTMAVPGRNLSEQNKKQDSYHHHHQQRRTPSTKTPFMVNQLKKAIPAHCFQRSLLRSSAYLFHDVTLSVIIYKSTSFFHLLPHPAATSFLLWPLYWLLQGSVLTGVWVIAHECGHQAFSDQQWLNDLIGFFLHSFLLVPYFSWKFSHRRHHANTCSLDNDEAFIPKPKSQIQWYLKYMNNPVGRALTLIGTLILGWPLYLTFNASGQPYDRFTSHFDPFSPIFSKNERLLVAVSDVGILTVLVILYKACTAKGLYWVLCVYGVPVMIVNGFLTLITYLNHTHKTVPYYDSSEWDWLRGALSTVDRDYGVLNKVFHNIADTHVAHHLFSTIPHYHAMEATKAIRPILGDYYHYDDTPIYKALWREAKECLYLEPEQEATSSPKGLYWYNNKF